MREREGKGARGRELRRLVFGHWARGGMLAFAAEPGTGCFPLSGLAFVQAVGDTLTQPLDNTAMSTIFDINAVHSIVPSTHR